MTLDIGNGFIKIETEEEREALLNMLRPQGKWIVGDYIDECRGYVARCSNCNLDTVGGGCYCRNCGADMRKGGKDMTNEEAIQFLENIKGEELGRAIGKEGFYADLLGYHIEALNKAIEALKNERPQGEWINREAVSNTVFPFWERYECDHCHKYNGYSNYCPNCGAQMEMKVMMNDNTKTQNL